MITTTTQVVQHEICELETLITANHVPEFRAKQLRHYFSVTPWYSKRQQHIRRAYWTADGVCLVTRWGFTEAVNWMAACDADDRRSGGPR